MSGPSPRSAGVTAAATLAILGCVSAFFVWGNFFLTLLNAPPDIHGRRLYQTHTLAFLLVSVVPSVLIALGLLTGIGLFRLRGWARRAALVWASIALFFSLAVIASRPYETFFIPEHFVSDFESLKQLAAISLVLLLLPLSVWWLFLFRSQSVKRQFLSSDSRSSVSAPTPQDIP